MSGNGTHGLDDRFSSFWISERAHHARRLRLAALVAALIAFLLFQTQWLILRPGLAILLFGQAGVALSLLWRNAKLANDLNRGDLKRRKTAITDESPLPVWFQVEELFIRRLAIFENACQVLGFVTLGYEIWLVTRSPLLALAIGLVYPATAYFGITRRRNLKALVRLRTEAQRFPASK